MPKYRVYGAIKATKFVGEYEADSKEEAEEMSYEDSCVSVCNHCSREVEDPEIDEWIVEEIKDED